MNEASASVGSVEPDQGLLSDLTALLVFAWRLSPRRLSVQLMLLLFGGLAGGVSLLLLVPIVNSVADSTANSTLPVIGDVELSRVPLWAMLAAFVALVALQTLVTRSSAINSMALQHVVVDQLRQEAFEAILAARWSFVLGRRQSDVIEIVTVGAARCGMAFSQFLQFSVHTVLALATAAVALLVSPMVAAISIVGVMGLGFGLSTSVRPAHRLGLLFGERNRQLQSVMTDSMDSLRLVRAHGVSAVWAEKLAGAFAGTRQVQIANVRRTSTVSAVSQVGLAAATAVLVLLAVWAEVPPPSIVVILILVARMARYVQSMAQTGAMCANALPAVGDLAKLTTEARNAAELPSGSAGWNGALSQDASIPLIEFRGVTFKYPKSGRGVADLTFSIERGEITVITGHSGAGKSTTADLVLGLLPPSEGEILIDGRPLTAADLPWWRRHVAYVPQETVLIPGTLRENLVWSVPGGASDVECWRALDRSSARFARALADGLDTLLGDRGLRLSGGERQRVAIARALLREPALLVLDEATSSLDDETEAAILDLMSSLVPAVTLLVIAHRRSTVDSARHVIRIENGRATDPAGIARK